MPAKKYAKKPVVVEAIQYDGQNVEEISNWALAHTATRSNLTQQGYNPIETPAVKMVDNPIYIHTALGRVAAVPGSYILYGGEDFYPCTADTFHKTYEAVDDQD